MNNFWVLVGFELKKILRRKLFWIGTAVSLVLVGVMVFASVSGASFWHKTGSSLSQYEAMQQDKQTILSKKGYVTPELLREAVTSYQEMTSNSSNYFENEYGKHLKAEAYIQYVLPYEAIINMLNVVYEENLDMISQYNGFQLITINQDKAIDRLSADSIQQFDTDLKSFMTAMVMRRQGLSSAEREKNLDFISQISLPLYNDYCGGYRAYIQEAKFLALTALFLILMLLCPIFSQEYEEKTDQILLCAKNGKGSLCRAKVFVALVISLVSSVSILGLGFLGFLAVLGSEGANVNIQLLDPSCTYPITLLQSCQIHFLSSVAACVLFGSLVCFLSAKAGRRTGLVVIIGTVLTIVPMFIWTSLKFSRLLYDGLKLFSVNSITFEFDAHFMNIGGKLIPPYLGIAAIGILLSIVFFFLAARSFKKQRTV